jgi:hypothetical protein
LEESREENGGLTRQVGKFAASATSTRRTFVPKKYKPQASEDAPKDEGPSEDFELHRHKSKAQATEDAPKDEGSDEGDFELHRKAHKAL